MTQSVRAIVQRLARRVLHRQQPAARGGAAAPGGQGSWSISPDASRSWPVGCPPTFLHVEVWPHAVERGQTVTVRWEAADAEAVAVDGRGEQQPARGWTDVVVEQSGPIELVAVNEHGTSSLLTDPVVVLPALPAFPAPPLLRLPLPPGAQPGGDPRSPR